MAASPNRPTSAPRLLESVELTSEALQEKFEKITGDNEKLRARFFQGSRNRDRERGTQGAPRTTLCDFELVDGKYVPVRLKAPTQQNYQLTRERTTATQPKAKWPADITLRNAPPQHIDTVPKHTELFFQSSTPPQNNSSSVKTPQGPAFGSTASRSIFGDSPPINFVPHRTEVLKFKQRVVYKRGTPTKKWFTPGKWRTYDDEAPTELPNFVSESELDNSDGPGSLLFESRFESGNLEEAKLVGDKEYELRLQTDLYTERHTQWFYFSVGNAIKGSTYTFNIVNLLKNDSLYNHGMQPVVYSTVAAEFDNKGWHRGGHDIAYFKNKRKVESARQERQCYTLTWKYTFQEHDDVVYFAHCYPYTYTNLQNYLTSLHQHPLRSKYIRHRVLCHTLCNNVCDVLTISNFNSNKVPLRLRKGIVVTARVHPGESNASWMCKGFMDFITSEDPDANVLRDHFVFKVVPMLNPDGVIVGNYRTGLAGVDLNRVYRTPSKELYPTVFHVKAMMRRFKKDRPVVLYCDLHGHSKKQNVFAYGCDSSLMWPQLRMDERVFIKMLELNGPEHFSLSSSRFHVKKAKESTGRVCTWREMKLLNTFTIEATFCGSTRGKNGKFQFNHKHFEKVGEILADTILDYWDPDDAKRVALLSALRNETLSSHPAEDDGDASSDSNGSDSSTDDEAQVEAQAHFVALKPKQEKPKVAIVEKKEPTKKKVSPKRKVRKDSKRRKALNRLSQPKTRATSAPQESVSQPTRNGKKTSKFKSKYDGRSSSGVPSFSEEQAANRLARQQAARANRFSQPQYRPAVETVYNGADIDYDEDYDAEDSLESSMGSIHRPAFRASLMEQIKQENVEDVQESIPSTSGLDNNASECESFVEIEETPEITGEVSTEAEGVEDTAPTITKEVSMKEFKFNEDILHQAKRQELSMKTYDLLRYRVSPTIERESRIPNSMSLSLQDLSLQSPSSVVTTKDGRVIETMEVESHLDVELQRIRKGKLSKNRRIQPKWWLQDARKIASKSNRRYMSTAGSLEPIPRRRCVCGAPSRHAVKELRENKGTTHFVRCDECQGFAPAD
eukprot:m.67150 g.67150  ORF g.67150 m.67150 type:complete len:1070 (+) comp11865_c0_seq2:211-3420(+)